MCRPTYLKKFPGNLLLHDTFRFVLILNHSEFISRNVSLHACIKAFFKDFMPKSYHVLNNIHKQYHCTSFMLYRPCMNLTIGSRQGFEPVSIGVIMTQCSHVFLKNVRTLIFKVEAFRYILGLFVL